MAGVKISELPAATSPVAPTDVLAVVQGGVTKKAAIDQLGFLQAGTNAVTRTAQAKMRDVVSVKDFGAVGDSNGTTGNGADDTVAFQSAINYIKASGGGYSLYVPEGTYRLTLRLLIDSAVRVVGEGCSPYVTLPGTRGNGSWLYFDHTGKGLQVDGTAALAGVAFEHFGTFRNQPTPAPGWAPTAHDYDIYVDNADTTIDEVVLLNPTKGFKLTNTNYGRLTIKRLRGQPLQIGIDIDECYDLPQISNVHFWPYWKDDANVHAYTLANLSAFYLQRVDNPQLVNIFTIYAKAGIQIHQSAAGTVSKLVLTNADFDRGVVGIWFDSSVTAVTSSKITNVSTQAEAGVSSTTAILIDGANINLQLENISLDSCSNNALRVGGSGNYLSIGNCSVDNYNVSGIGFPAFEANNGNTIQFALVPKVTGGSGAPVYSTTGTIFSDDLWVNFATTVTTTSGSITTLGSVDCKYKKRGAIVDLFIDISITTNGTGTGAVQFTLPIAAVPLSIGVGREINVAGKTLSLQSSGAFCTIQNYDNSYPGSNGCRLVGSISYRV